MIVETVLALLFCLTLYLWLKQRKINAQLNKKLRQQMSEMVEKTLRERHRFLETLADAFLLVDDASRIVFANSVARHILNDRKIIGRSIREVFFHDQFVDIIQASIDKKEAVTKKIIPLTNQPLTNQTITTERIWVVDAAPVEEEEVTRVIIRDITAEHQIDQVRQDFVANASHELRTPMVLINGYIENLLDDDIIDDTETARRFLETMRKHSMRISRLIEDMLVISKIESGGALNLTMSEFNFKNCVLDVRQRLEPMIQDQDASVEIITTPSDLKIVGDQFYWAQIIFNLVENALKQNPSPGLNVRLEAQQKENHTLIQIIDDGIGIPSVDLPYIFKRFYRADKHHTNSEIKGTGLGLSIVSRAIEAHGGKITANSTPGVETSFIITLPHQLH